MELLNDIYHNFVKVKGDVAPLLMCPTEYNRLWTKLEEVISRRWAASFIRT